MGRLPLKAYAADWGFSPNFRLILNDVLDQFGLVGHAYHRVRSAKESPQASLSCLEDSCHLQNKTSKRMIGIGTPSSQSKAPLPRPIVFLHI